MNYSPFAELLCREAAKSITPLFRNPLLEVREKPDRSPVTQADTRAEAAMRQIINEYFPEHGIIGEEYGAERERADYVWYLDPIDGTVSFACGVPLFGTLVALTYRGEPVLGVIHQPVLDWWCIGDGTVTTVNGRTTTMRPVGGLNEAKLLVTDPVAVQRAHPASSDGFSRLMNSVALVRGWGDCLGYYLLAEGSCDIMLDAVMAPWDIMPLIPIIRGAGGAITDWAGGPAHMGSSSVAAHPSIHSLVLDQLRPAQ